MPRSRLQAPRGKFRVIGVDTFSNEDWLEGDFKSKTTAVKRADEKGGVMTKMYVYDSKGRQVHAAGTF